MAGPRGDVAVPKQRALVDVRIKLRFDGLVSRIAGPAHKIGNCARWPIAIEHLDYQAASREIARNFGQCVCSGLGEQATRRTVTVDRSTDKIVRTCIADVGDQAWNDGSRIDE